ncbi:hypothetical protein DH86_00001916 [Scytalidium sp. 3C]|nr:hypothetical protein DH86_00001916 [Scytalidium sp. 3C]
MYLTSDADPSDLPELGSPNRRLQARPAAPALAPNPRMKREKRFAPTKPTQPTLHHSLFLPFCEQKPNMSGGKAPPTSIQPVF